MSLASTRQKRETARTVLVEGDDPADQKWLDQPEAKAQARTMFILVAREYLEQADDTQLLPEKALSVLNERRLRRALGTAQKSDRSINENSRNFL